MLGRRQRTRPPTGTGGALTDPGPDEDAEYDDEAEEDAGSDAEWDQAGEADEDDEREEDDTEHIEDEYADEADEDDEAPDDETDEYDDEYEDETDAYDDETDDYDDYEDEDEDEEEDAGETPEPFTPPTFLEAAKQAFRPKRPEPAGAAGSGTQPSGTAGSRQRAQPATGTEEDARAVNLIDSRERTIGFVLGIGLLILSVLAYVSDHHYTNKDLAKQLEVRHAAVEVLIIFAVMGAATVAVTLVKRRALLGFILTFSGLALLQTLGFFGLLYLGAGGWLIFRALKRSPRSRARQNALAAKSDARTTGTGAGSRASTASSGSTSTRTTSGTRTGGADSRSGTASSQRQIGRNNRTGTRATGSRAISPVPSGRYTPPKQNRRPPPAKPPDQPEPSNRLTAWLRK